MLAKMSREPSLIRQIGLIPQDCNNEKVVNFKDDPAGSDMQNLNHLKNNLTES